MWWMEAEARAGRTAQRPDAILGPRDNCRVVGTETQRRRRRGHGRVKRWGRPIHQAQWSNAGGVLAEGAMLELAPRPKEIDIEGVSRDEEKKHEPRHQQPCG